ncbi:hypothetical protein N9E93_01805 [Oceanospirillaceae bacterium]|nr:hypothetical protein [Oceanospirillaceae bacterium]
MKIAGLHAYALLVLQGMVWGSSFQAIKYALEGFGPMSVAAGRIFIAALVWFLVDAADCRLHR